MPGRGVTLMPAVKPKPTSSPSSLETPSGPRPAGSARIEVLDLRADRERQPIGHLDGDRRVHVDREDLRFAGDPGLVEDRIAMVLRAETERAVDADPEHEAVIQTVGRVAGRDERVLRKVAFVGAGKSKRWRGSSFTSASGKMPVPTASTRSFGHPRAWPGSRTSRRGCRRPRCRRRRSLAHRRSAP